MCKKCETISKQFHAGDLDESEALAKAAKLMQGKGGDHVSDLLDDILGTKLEESNPDLDEAWEKSYRKEE